MQVKPDIKGILTDGPYLIFMAGAFLVIREYTYTSTTDGSRSLTSCGSGSLHPLLLHSNVCESARSAREHCFLLIEHSEWRLSFWANDPKLSG